MRSGPSSSKLCQWTLYVQVGSNPRIEAPLLNSRIRKMVRHHGLEVATVGKPVDLTYEVENVRSLPPLPPLRTRWTPWTASAAVPPRSGSCAIF